MVVCPKCGKDALKISISMCFCENCDDAYVISDDGCLDDDDYEEYYCKDCDSEMTMLYKYEGTEEWQCPVCGERGSRRPGEKMIFDSDTYEEIYGIDKFPDKYYRKN